MRGNWRGRTLLAGSMLLALGGTSMAMPVAGAGPFDARLLEGGVGIEREIKSDSAAFNAGAPFSITLWVRADRIATGRVVLAAMGDLAGSDYRALIIEDGRLGYVEGARILWGAARIAANSWTHVGVSSDGRTARFFVNGKRVAQGAMPSAAVARRIAIAPTVPGQAHFGGHIVRAWFDDAALAPSDFADHAARTPDIDVLHVWNVGQGWEFQSKAQTGLWRPQDAWTLPQSAEPPSAPVAKPVLASPELAALAPGRWQLNGWTLAAAPDVTADGATISSIGFDPQGWMAATVPGTVLTTMVDRGVYPDPYYGLNNMAIPEKLARQDYWYRASFDVPAQAAGQKTELLFNGINYAAEVWINGAKAGNVKGAFIRGRFPFTPVAGRNVVAVRISPPPHPGIPHEQSRAAGPGENGGQLAIDGPTFVSSEGWDWVPGIRDRNAGLWQGVELVATGAVVIGDPQIITDLPLPRTDSADLYVTVPVENRGAGAIRSTLTLSFDGRTITRTVDLSPGKSEVRFTPSTDAALVVRQPRLWWPNGYGEPNLYTAKIVATVDGRPSDEKSVRFGIREVSYDLGLFNAAGALNRVNVQTTNGRLEGQQLVDIRHVAIKETPRGWAQSLTPAGERSAAVTPVTDYAIPEPHLALRVNGVKIAARGGNWGMDDAMKRSGRERLEPYFRLQKDAHMNIIRNWMGNNTQPEFFDLADEYGMMVMSDFWQSTQNFQIEPQDPALFLANARDTVARYRNHPSIVMWFGRNEGVPYPLLNEGLNDVVFELDGTRWYTGSSNVVNLQWSGPYNYRPPAGYFTDLATGFSVETGTPSLSTLESIKAYTPASDRWPLSDTLAYHDWHFGGNGDTRTFMQTIETMFGPSSGLEDFERKAQMMNLETHKAMYEGFFAHLWTKNTGRMLWMTHPAWPSHAWQIYSWDYDTHGAFYGAKKASEPLHIQLDLPDNRLTVVNTTQEERPGLVARTIVTDLAGKTLLERQDAVNAPANAVTALSVVPLDGLFQANPMLLVKLSLTDGSGAIVSDNFYWRGKTTGDYRAMTRMASVPLALAVSGSSVDGRDRRITVTLRNGGTAPALAAKLTLEDAAGARILPALYEDNYVSLLPGEERRIVIRYPADRTARPVVRLRGWNVVEGSAQAGE